MTRTTIGLCFAAALGFAVSLGAQSSTTTTTPDQRTAARGDKSAKEVTVTGCLARAADGTFMLNNARSDDMSRSQPGATTTGSSNPTTTTAGTPTGTSGTTAGSTAGTTAAEPSASGAMHHEAMAWKLEGGTDLERHVGHEIQVTGRTDWNEHSMSSSTTTTGTSGSAASSATTTAKGEKGMNEPRLEVSSVKMISSSCR